VIYQLLSGHSATSAEMVLAWHPRETAPTVMRLVAVARSVLAEA